MSVLARIADGKNMAERRTKQGAGTVRLIYILYLLAIVNGITALMGMLIAWISKSGAPKWMRSHYRFQIRTFWMALLFGTLGISTVFIGIGFLILFGLVIWYVIRCIKGFLIVGQGKAYPDPKTWLW